MSFVLRQLGFFKGDASGSKKRGDGDKEGEEEGATGLGSDDDALPEICFDGEDEGEEEVRRRLGLVIDTRKGVLDGVGDEGCVVTAEDELCAAFVAHFQSWQPRGEEEASGEKGEQQKVGCHSGHPTELIRVLCDIIGRPPLSKEEGRRDEESASTSTSAQAFEILTRSRHNHLSLLRYSGIRAAAAYGKRSVDSLDLVLSGMGEKATWGEGMGETLEGIHGLLGGMGNLLLCQWGFLRAVGTETRRPCRAEIMREVIESGGLGFIVRFLEVSASLFHPQHPLSNIMPPDTRSSLLAVEERAFECIACAGTVDVAAQAHIRTLGGIDVLLSSLGRIHPVDSQGSPPININGTEMAVALERQLDCLHALWYTARRNMQSSNLVWGSSSGSERKGKTRKISNIIRMAAFIDDCQRNTPGMLDQVFDLFSYLLVPKERSTEDGTARSSSGSSSSSSDSLDVMGQFILAGLFTSLEGLAFSAAVGGGMESSSSSAFSLSDDAKSALLLKTVGLLKKLMGSCPSMRNYFNELGAWDILLSPNCLLWNEWRRTRDEGRDFRRSVLKLCSDSVAVATSRRPIVRQKVPEVSRILQLVCDQGIEEEILCELVTFLSTLLSEYHVLTTYVMQYCCASTMLLAAIEERTVPEQQERQTSAFGKGALALMIDFLSSVYRASTELRVSALTESDEFTTMLSFLTRPTMGEMASNLVVDIMVSPLTSTYTQSSRRLVYEKYMEHLSMAGNDPETGQGTILILLAVVNEVTKRNKEMQDLFLDTGCFLQVVSLLNNRHQGDNQLVKGVLLTLLHLMRGNESAKQYFNNNVGYDALKSLLLLRAANGPLDPAILCAMLDLSLDNSEISVSSHVYDAMCRGVEKEANAKNMTFSGKVWAPRMDNPRALLVAFELLKNVDQEVQRKVLGIISYIADISLSNRASMNTVGIVGAELEWIRTLNDCDDNRPIVHQLANLLRSSACYSISGKELRLWLSLLQARSEGEAPPHYTLLLRTLRKVTHRDGPSAFFHFSGNPSVSGIIRRGPLAWSSARSLSFATWLRTEGFDSTREKQYTILSMQSAKGTGIILTLSQAGIWAHISPGQQKMGSYLIPFKFSPSTWYHIVVSLSLARTLIGGSIKLSVNGKISSTIPITMGKITDRFDVVAIGCHPLISVASENLSFVSPFYGQLGTIYCFDEVLSEQVVSWIFALGPNYWYRFMEAEYGTAPQDVSRPVRTMFEDSREISTKLLYSFCAAAACDRGCYNTSSGMLLSSVMNDAVEDDVSEVLPETQLCITFSVSDMISCHGGVGILYPMIPEAYTFFQAGQTVLDPSVEPLNPVVEIILIIATIVDGNQQNSRDMIDCSGCETLSFLLCHAPSDVLDSRLVVAFEQLLHAASDNQLREHIIKFLIMDVSMWSLAEETALFHCLNFLLRLSRAQPRTLKPIIETSRVLHYISHYFCGDFGEDLLLESSQSDLSREARSNFRCLSSKRCAEARAILLRCIDAVSQQTLSSEEIDDIMGTILTCETESALEDLLNFLMKQLESLASLSHVMSKGGALLFLGLLKQRSSSVRLRVLRILNVLLQNYSQTNSLASSALSSPLRRSSLYALLGSLQESISGSSVSQDSQDMKAFVLREANAALEHFPLDEGHAAELLMAALEWEGFELAAISLPCTLSTVAAVASASGNPRLKLPPAISCLLSLAIHEGTSPQVRFDVILGIYRIVMSTLESLGSLIEYCTGWQQGLINFLISTEKDNAENELTIKCHDLIFSIFKHAHLYSMYFLPEGWRVVEESVYSAIASTENQDAVVHAIQKRFLHEVISGMVVAEAKEVSDADRAGEVNFKIKQAIAESSNRQHIVANSVFVINELRDFFCSKEEESLTTTECIDPESSTSSNPSPIPVWSRDDWNFFSLSWKCIVFMSRFGTQLKISIGADNEKDKASLSKTCSRLHDTVWNFVSQHLAWYLARAPLASAAASVSHIKEIFVFMFDEVCISQGKSLEINTSLIDSLHQVLSDLLQLQETVDAHDAARGMVISQVLRETLGRGQSLLTIGFEEEDKAKKDDGDEDMEANNSSSVLGDDEKDGLLIEANQDIASLLSNQRISRSKKAKETISLERKNRLEEHSSSRQEEIDSFSVAVEKTMNKMHEVSESKIADIVSRHRSKHNADVEKTAAATLRVKRAWHRLLRTWAAEDGPWAESMVAIKLRERESWRWKADKMEDARRRRIRLKRKYYTKTMMAAETSDGMTDAEAECNERSNLNLESLSQIPLQEGIIDEEETLELDQIVEDDKSSVSSDANLLEASLAKTEGGQPLETNEPRKIVFESDCILVTSTRVVSGTFKVSSKTVTFQEVPKSEDDSEETTEGNNGDGMSLPKYKTIEIVFIERIYLCRYLLRHSALEIRLFNRSSIFISFPSKSLAKKAAQRISSEAAALGGAHSSASLPYIASGIAHESGTSPQKVPASLPKSAPYTPMIVYTRKKAIEAAEKFKDLWRRRELSNFDYLMNLNTLAGRTYNDLTQYPVFPWILQDYTSEKLDLENPGSFRDLSLPIGALNPSRREFFIERYESLLADPNTPPFHYGTHYSSSAIVQHYLLRLEPYTTLHRNLQGGKFDHADRLFYSVENTWNNCLKGTADVKELIPEFFYQPEFLRNVNSLDIGKLQDGRSIADVDLPPWADGSPEKFIRLHREALESEYVSQHIHQWIDLIFGQKQKGKAAVEATNVFYHLTYEGAVDLEAIDDVHQKRAIEEQIIYFGQTPSQLFKYSHPPRGAKQSVSRPRFRQASKLFLISRISVSAQTSPVVGIKVIDGRVVVVHEDRRMNVHRLLGVGSGSLLGGSFTFSSTSYSLEVDKMPPRRPPVPLSSALRNSPSLSSFIAGSKYLLTCGHWDRGIRVTTTDDGREVQMVVRHSDVVTCMATSEDKVLVTGSADTCVMIWDVTPYRTVGGNVCPLSDYPVGVIHVHGSLVTCVAVSLTLDTVASGSQNGGVALHSLSRRNFIATLSLEDADAQMKAAPLIIRISEITGLVAVYWNCLALSVHSINGRRLAAIEIAERVNDMIVSLDGEFLIISGEKGTLSILSIHDLSTRYQLYDFPHITCLAHVSDDCLVVGLKSGEIALLTTADEDE